MAVFTFEEIQKACGGEFNIPVDCKKEIKGVITDSRMKVQDSVFFALSGDRFDAHDFLGDAAANGAILLCIEKTKADKVPDGVAALLVESPLNAYQALAAFHRSRFSDLKVIALTGSYGKTSTKEILRTIFCHVAGSEHVLATEGNTNNQIGVPRNLLNLTSAHKYAVIEMGTNHFGEIEPLVKCARPEASLIVSIGNCHLEFFKNFQGVAEEKSSIFKQNSVKLAAFPFHGPERGVLEKAALSVPKIMTFGDSPRASVQAVYKGGNLTGSRFELIRTSDNTKVTIDWNLTGKHQAVNAAGAAAIALGMGISLETVAEAIHEVNLPGLRMKKTTHGEALWINDAYNANPDSMCASLTWLTEFADPEKLLLVLGDMGELGENSLKGHLQVLNFALEYLPGARIAAVGPKMAEALAVLSLEFEHTNVTVFASAKNAVDGVAKLVRPGDLVFLKGSRATGLEIIEPRDM